MASSGYTSMAALERETCKVFGPDGQIYTMKEWKEMLKAKAKAEGKTTTKKRTKKAKKNEKEVTEVAAYIEKVIAQMTALKSFGAYYDHAYRQWGTIAKSILNNHKVRVPFVKYRVALSEMNGLLDEVDKYARLGEKAVYQYVEKLSWKLEDIKENLDDILKGAHESKIFVTYKDHEAINGSGKRLGLQTLAKKSFKAITQMETAIKELKHIAEVGIDPFKYGDYMTPHTRSRCWA